MLAAISPGNDPPQGARHGDRHRPPLAVRRDPLRDRPDDRRRRRFDYLLKDRVLDIDELADAIRRVAAGGTAVDPVVIEQVMVGVATTC